MKKSDASPAGKRFNFPYANPYDIQRQYMEQLFQTLHDGKIGIFESPTGSGKSLSLICGALTWLQTYYAERDGIVSSDGSSMEMNEKKRSLSDHNDDDDEPAWVLEQTTKRKKEEEELKRQEQLEKSKKNVQKYDDRRKQFIENVLTSPKKSVDDDDELLLKETVTESIGINNELLKDLYDEDSDDERPIFSSGPKIEAEETFQTPKIIYCSRTHSQLDQFIQELRRTEFSKKIRAVNLASRQLLCNNEDVLFKTTKNGKVPNSLNRINEQCLYLRDKKGCSYDNDTSLFKDHLTVKVHDIEDMVNLGKKLKICSYYGSRKAIPNAELICMPYNSLIHEQTRKSLGVTSLKDCVVIIDEAHNLVNAIHHTHSIQIELKELNMVHDCLQNYFSKFKNRLSTTNQTNIKRLLNIIESLTTYLKTFNKGDEKAKETGVIETITDLLFETKLDNVNLFEVAEFIETSELTKKLNLFMEKQDANLQNQVVIHNNNTVKRTGNSANYVHYAPNKSSVDLSKITTPATSNNAINNFISMLLALMNVDKDGKILVKSNQLIKFLLLNPSVYFQSIVNEARSVILTGGTMEPITALTQQLFPKTDASRIHIYQCDHHIMPANHFLPMVLTKGLGDVEFDFRFQTRKNEDLINSLGRTILNLCNIVPDGIVIFFPSYQYEKQVYECWQKNGIISNMEKKKKFLREASVTEDATSLDKILHEYRNIIDHNFSQTATTGGGVLQRYNGSILSCVVGGKLSEGINFSDGYGRLVVVVGLPYPNPNDIELLEQQKFFEKNTKKPQNDFLDNICMNAVNQSIGRSIRHNKDYACVLLLDKRYQQAKLTNKLSRWIRKDLVVHDSAGKVFGAVGQFFKEKSSNQMEIEKQRKEKWTSSISLSKK